MKSAMTLHDKMVKHISAVDFSKATVEELTAYSGIMFTLYNMEKPDLTSELLKSMSNISSTKNEGGANFYGS